MASHQSLFTTQEEVDIRIAESLQTRELEITSYEFEAIMHTEAIAAMGNISWTDDLLVYRGMTRDELIRVASSNGMTSSQIGHISNLNLLDKHRQALEAVKIEKEQSLLRYNSTLGLLPAGPRREAAIAALLQKTQPVV